MFVEKTVKQAYSESILNGTFDPVTFSAKLVESARANADNTNLKDVLKKPDDISVATLARVKRKPTPSVKPTKAPAVTNSTEQAVELAEETDAEAARQVETGEHRTPVKNTQVGSPFDWRRSMPPAETEPAATTDAEGTENPPDNESLLSEKRIQEYIRKLSPDLQKWARETYTDVDFGEKADEKANAREGVAAAYYVQNHDNISPEELHNFFFYENGSARNCTDIRLSLKGNVRIHELFKEYHECADALAYLEGIQQRDLISEAIQLINYRSELIEKYPDIHLPFIYLYATIPRVLKYDRELITKRYREKLQSSRKRIDDRVLEITK